MSSSSSAAAASTAPAKRACDSCHRRKVKCLPIGDEASPCRNCVSAGLECTFYNKVQKKGPKGSRAKVLSEIRETQKFISPRPPSADLTSRSASPTVPFQRTPGFLNQALVVSCVEYYFANLYALQPVLHMKSVDRTVANMDQSIEAYCMITALCSFVLMQSKSTLPPTLRSIVDLDQPGSNNFARLLLDEAIRVRRGHEWSEDPNILTIYTSFFIFQCQNIMDRHDSAWIHLRQATTLAHIIGLHDEKTYAAEESQIFSTLRRKLFWTLFISERIFAIKHLRPLSLWPTIHELDPQHEDGNPALIFGFIQLVKLYKQLDDKFFAYWTNQAAPDLSSVWLDDLESRINDIVPTLLEYLEVSSVDLIVSHQWLKVAIWRLRARFLSIESSSTAPLRFKTLYSGCRELVHQLSPYPRTTLEVDGLELFEKLYDITCALSDGCDTVPFSLAYETRDCLNALFTILSSLSSAQPHLLSSLQTKLSRQFGSNQSFIPEHVQRHHDMIAGENSPPVGMQNPLALAFADPAAASLAIVQNVAAFGHPQMQYSELNNPGAVSGYHGSNAEGKRPARYGDYYYMDD